MTFPSNWILLFYQRTQWLQSINHEGTNVLEGVPLKGIRYETNVAHFY